MESTYKGSDGLLHCSKCSRPLEGIINLLGIKKKVGLSCECMENKEKEFQEKLIHEERTRKRNICFKNTNMHYWNFANDDKQNQTVSNAVRIYAERFKEMLPEGQGLLLYGDVGTGKTFYAACIANSLIDSGYNVLMTNFSQFTNRLQGTFEKQEMIDDLNRYHLLILDDLGAERKSEFMQEQVFNIIDSRYRAGLPMIITTNLTAQELQNPSDLGFSRIYDRVLERCFPVKVSGESRRKAGTKGNYKNMKSMLGL